MPLRSVGPGVELERVLQPRSECLLGTCPGMEGKSGRRHRTRVEVLAVPSLGHHGGLCQRKQLQWGEVNELESYEGE